MCSFIPSLEFDIINQETNLYLKAMSISDNKDRKFCLRCLTHESAMSS